MTNAIEVARAYEGIIERFTAWATAEPSIRSAVVIGSRARVDHPADEWADLDIVIWSTDPEPYLASAAWTAALGEPWITFTEISPDPRVRERRVLFAGGLDVDLAFVDPNAAPQSGEGHADMAGLIFGRGGRVLVDKDGVTTQLLAVASPPVLPVPPTSAALDQAASDFWYHAVWTAKHLRRGELWWAKGSCDGHLKGLLRVVLEWDAAANGRDPWFRGRFLEEWADPGVVRGLDRAFARYDEEDLWAALARTMDLFSHVAHQLATTLKLVYPEHAEARARELVLEYRARRGGNS